MANRAAIRPQLADGVRSRLNIQDLSLSRMFLLSKDKVRGAGPLPVTNNPSRLFQRPGLEHFPASHMERLLEPRPVVPICDKPVNQQPETPRIQSNLTAHNASLGKTDHV